MTMLIPHHDDVQLENLYQPYWKKSTLSPGFFEDLTSRAAEICQTRQAWLSLKHKATMVIEFQMGLCVNQTEVYLDWEKQILAQWPGMGSELFILEDTGCEGKFAKDSLIGQEPFIRFYAAVRLMNSRGQLLGILSVMDTVPHRLTQQQQEALKLLANDAIAQLEFPQTLSHLQQIVNHCKLPDVLLQRIDLDQSPLAQVLASVSDAVLLSDPTVVDNPIVYANAGFTEISGYDAKEVIGEPLFFLEGKETDPQILQQLHESLQQPHPQEVTLLSYRKDGEVFWNQLKLCPLFSSDGLLLNFLVSFKDVTAQQQNASKDVKGKLWEITQILSRTLAQSQDLKVRLQTCLEAIATHLEIPQISLWQIHPKLNQLVLQASVTPETATNEVNSQNLFLQPFITLEDPFLGAVAQTGQGVLNQSIPLSETDQDLITAFPLVVEEQVVGVLALSSPFPLPEVVYSGLEFLTPLIALGIDRASVKEALHVRREVLLFRLASQIRNSLDLDTILGTAVNEIRNLLQVDLCQYVWCWSHPVSPSIAVSHEASDFDPPNLLANVAPNRLVPLAKRILSLQTLRVNNTAQAWDLDSETQTLLKDLGITSQLLIPIQTHAGQMGAILCSHHSPRPWSDSEVELLQGVVDQLAIAIDQAELFAQTRAAALAAQTQAKQLQQALQELKSTESRLIQSEKMSSLGQMVAGIAHEINNPVNFISGNIDHASNYIQDLLDFIALYQQHFSEPPEEIEEFAEDIDFEFIVDDLPKLLSSMQMGTERICQIVKSLRSFSRLDEAEMKPVNIHEGIDSTLLILHNRLKTGVEIIKNYGDLPRVECYPGQLNQVFMNIIANAIDALDTEEENKQITITTEFHESPTPEFRVPSVMIRIQDNGQGMTEDVRTHLFDPFFTTKPVGKGTGMGLSICYQIIEKHNGIIKCVSELGQGAEFIIQIPLSQTGERN
ncbi:MAG: GAF domain-containing protein [Chroococcales cyanobacterium]